MSDHPSAALRHPPPFLPQGSGARHALACLAAAVLLSAASHLADAESKHQLPLPLAAVAPAREQAPPQAGPQPVVPVLDVRMRKALDYTARRYKLSPNALEPIFFAAKRAAQEAGLDPLLVIAVIGVESGFNPLSGSVMGAQGLMQIIPRYHADKLQRVNRAGEPAELALFDPVINVRVGTQVLHEYIRASGGIVEGLQQYVGAVDDPDEGYAAKVLAELERLEAAARKSGGSA